MNFKTLSKRSTPKILHRTGELRRQTTPAEKKLWSHLRLMREGGIHFRRQYAIGPFITDFCAIEPKLIIEPWLLQSPYYVTLRERFSRPKGLGHGWGEMLRGKKRPSA